MWFLMDGQVLELKNPRLLPGSNCCFACRMHRPDTGLSGSAGSVFIFICLKSGPNFLPQTGCELVLLSLSLSLACTTVLSQLQNNSSHSVRLLRFTFLSTETGFAFLIASSPVWIYRHTLFEHTFK